MSIPLSSLEALARNDHATALAGLHDVHEAFAKWLYLPDIAVVDVTLATVVAHRLGGDPVWTTIVAPPGGGKTEVIQSLGEIPEVHALSALTAQTFASGLKGKREASLFRRLERDGKTFLTLKDFTTVLTMHRDARQEILAQLREIYDGSYRKEFGTGETVQWEGRLGFLAGVTPAIDQHHSVTSLLGERFLYLRLPQTDRRQLSDRALADRGSEKEMREELRSVVGRFIESLEMTAPVLSDGSRERMIALADFTTWVRSGVPRDSYGARDILAVPQPEAPTRFVKQIAGLYSALCLMGYREDDGLLLVTRIAYDSVPPVRLAVLRALRAAGELETPSLCDAVGLPTSTAKYVAEDLTALGLLGRTAGSGGPHGAHRWRLGERAIELWASFDQKQEGTAEEVEWTG